ncbi:MAG: hypothetical protein AMXMBFR48_15340 [Ignavibacteriales bacterium]
MSQFQFRPTTKKEIKSFNMGYHAGQQSMKTGTIIAGAITFAISLTIGIFLGYIFL